MQLNYETLYQQALEHRESHQCGAVPFQNKNLLIELVQQTKAKKVLEIGTGIGYSTICLATANDEVIVETVDKDPIHIALAKENVQKFNLTDRVIFHLSKAEDLFPKLKGEYDLIFYDGYVPQRKFVKQFERLLKKGGVLISANLFLANPKGGKYLKSLQENPWETKVIQDNAISSTI